MERGGDVGVDISLEGWQGALIAKGVDSKKPPVWLLEGLTVYLTETEFLALWRHLSPLRSVVSPGRHVAGPGWRESWRTARFTTRNHTHILAPFCWAEVQMQTLQQLRALSTLIRHRRVRSQCKDCKRRKSSHSQL